MIVVIEQTVLLYNCCCCCRFDCSYWYLINTEVYLFPLSLAVEIRNVLCTYAQSNALIKVIMMVTTT